MPGPSLLLTQCLQNDFVQPIGAYDSIPNALHVGHHEARRLMSEDPADGPVAHVMRWAHAQPDERLRLVHIRDWHDPHDPAQADHLARFGSHCLAGTSGAAFAFDDAHAGKDVAIVDSRHLNDFVDTDLQRVLAPFAQGPRRVGIVGVWTEAKVSFLAYDLRTRYAGFEVAVCSALTASSSRQHHFAALDRLERILGVRVIDSVGEFLAFLGGPDVAGAPGPAPRDPGEHPRVTGEVALDATDRMLVRHLFRDCRRVQLRGLGGGFSGNVVAASTSEDLHGHEQVPHVVKIGAAAAIGRERSAFERIQGVLGNNAPQIADFVDYGGRGALKYRYASMGAGTAGAGTLQARYAAGVELVEIERILDTVFVEQLGRLYRAATLESCDLLEHYWFHSDRAPGVRRAVAAILGHDPQGEALEVAPGVWTPNPCRFYEETLRDLPARPRDTCWFAFVHGDLNGANIVLDARDNVWLIDFFHTRRAHVLMDLVKLENDVQYIFTPLADEADLRRACAMTDTLLGVEDLGAGLPDAAPEHVALRRAWHTIGKLRSYYPDLVRSDRDPWQLLVAQLRYAAHTLSFDEPSDLQRRWALYATGRLTAAVADRLLQSTLLRLDFLDHAITRPGRLAITLLPGRADVGRRLADDLAVIREAGVRRVLCLVPDDELDHYGVPELRAELQRAGLVVHHLPIPDQRATSESDMAAAVRFIDDGVTAGETTLVHCVAGLGRSGTAVACWLRTRGLSADDALAEVRRARSPRAVETRAQEDFVRAFTRA
jgi:protein-tyrosine phosphatase